MHENDPIQAAPDEEYVDPVIEAYKKDIDLTLIRHNLSLSVQERVDNLIALNRAIEEFRRAGEALRSKT